MVEDWSEITITTLQSAWQGFLLFLPKLIGAIIVFVIGWLISVLIGKVITEILNRIKLNKIFERTGWQEAFEKAELKINPSEFIGAICKWILVIVFLLAAVDILELKEFAVLLTKIVSWLPNVIVAVIIFVVAIILADILEKIVKAWVKKMELGFANFLGTAVKIAIYVLAVLAILVQLNVTPTIVNTLVIGFVGTISLALGLSFGLGGKDAAARLIEDLRRKISEK